MKRADATRDGLDRKSIVLDDENVDHIYRCFYETKEELDSRIKAVEAEKDYHKRNELRENLTFNMNEFIAEFDWSCEGEEDSCRIFYRLVGDELLRLGRKDSISDVVAYELRTLGDKLLEENIEEFAQKAPGEN